MAERPPVHREREFVTTRVWAPEILKAFGSDQGCLPYPVDDPCLWPWAGTRERTRTEVVCQVTEVQGGGFGTNAVPLGCEVGT